MIHLTTFPSHKLTFLGVKTDSKVVKDPFLFHISLLGFHFYLVMNDDDDENLMIIIIPHNHTNNPQIAHT